MEKQQAISLIENVFSNKFSDDSFRKFITQLFNDFNAGKATSLQAGNYIYEPYRSHVKSFKRLGQYKTPNENLLDILTVKVQSGYKLERARTALRNFAIEYLRRKDDSRDSLLIAFFSDDYPDWRLSFIKLEYKTEKDTKGKIKVKQEVTSAKRYSFLVGENEPSHTAKKQFLPLLIDTENNPALEEIENVFNIEKVTKEFFEQYKTLFLRLNEGLENLIEKDSSIQKDFKEKGIETTAFTKKLLGQIVFLYFIQKKGWLGVPKDKNFGQGSKKFLKALFDDAVSKGKNYFNGYLEPLFYEALAVQRTSVDPSYYKRFDCRIPFLNGGLFEPIKDYDWNNTEIIIPNELFSNTKITKENDIGTGILDVFDRFNFTVKEDEPLEKEVAVDPEMLGKVFENLLEVKDRKSKGAFYTPREIVHYMCQESLVNYLDTVVNSNPVYQEIGKDQIDLFGNKARKGQLKIFAEHKNKNVSIPKNEIETFVKHSHLVVEDNRLDRNKKSYQLPDSIKKYAEKLDDTLADIKVCDPAIGSGAFPVGMLNEIVRARIALTQYLDIDDKNRTSYHLKRECIQNSLYGVDIDSSAIDIAKLRLWLSLVVDEESIQDIEPLPNLDYKIVCGNSLLGFPNDWNSPITQEIEKIKNEYFDTTDLNVKRKLKKQIDEKINLRYKNSEKIFGFKINFDFKTVFSEVWHYKKGFDVVLGNPPYGRYTKIPKTIKERLKKTSVYGNTSDLAEFFINKTLNVLVTKNGCNAFIVPKGLSYVKAWSDTRKRLLDKTELLSIIDAGKAFEKVLYEMLVYIAINRIPQQSMLTTGFLLDGVINEVPIKKNILNHQTFYFGMSLNHFNILEKVTKKCSAVSNYMIYWYGKGGITPKTNKELRGFKVLTGKEVQRYFIKEIAEKWYIENKYLTATDFARKNTEKVVVQDIVAHITKPVPHVKLTASIDTKNQFCLNTVMCFAEKTNLKNKFLLAILNSRFISFYYYYYVYNQAIRTMHFMPGYADLLPIPHEYATHQKPIIKLVDKILENTYNQYKFLKLDTEIDARVAHLYNLTEDEYKMVLEGSEDTFRITALNLFRDIKKEL